MDGQKQEKKRVPKSGFRRVTVTLAEEEYKMLVGVAEQQMREPNNLLSFLLKGEIASLVDRK